MERAKDAARLGKGRLGREKKEGAREGEERLGRETKREGRSERGSEGSRDGERARCGAAPRDSAAWRKMPHAHIGAGSERAAGEGNGSWRTCVCAVICMGI